jgi:hypothetical protein
MSIGNSFLGFQDMTGAIFPPKKSTHMQLFKALSTRECRRFPPPWASLAVVGMPPNEAQFRELSALPSCSDSFIQSRTARFQKGAVSAFRDAMTLLLVNIRQAVILGP